MIYIKLNRMTLGKEFEISGSTVSPRFLYTHQYSRRTRVEMGCGPHSAAQVPAPRKLQRVIRVEAVPSA